MNKITAISLSCLLASAAIAADAQKAQEQEKQDEPGKWRISAGFLYNTPVKTHLRFAPATSMKSSSSRSGVTRSQAGATAGGVKDGSKTTYSSGAWFDKDCTGDAVYTWNGAIPDARSKLTSDKLSFVIDSAEYSETETKYSAFNLGSISDSTEQHTPGLNIEISRNICRNVEKGRGMDIALGLSYFWKDDFFSIMRGYNVGNKTVTSRAGSIDTTINTPERDIEAVPLEYWQWNDDGSYGNGSFDGFGPVFDLSSVSTHDNNSSSHVKKTSFNGGINARGDYKDLEFLLSVKPYYDLASWLRLVGTVGVAVSRAELDIDLKIVDRGNSISRNYDCTQWDVYGIAGAGFLLRYDDFTLGAEGFIRFLDDDVEIDEEYVRGTLERGRWYARLSLGYEF